MRLSVAGRSIEFEASIPSRPGSEFWPACRALIGALERAPRCGGECIDLGCGCGVVGLAALALGYRVTFCDVSIDSLALAERNARANGFSPSSFDLLNVDWRNPEAFRGRRWSSVFGSEVLYEWGPSLATIRRIWDGRGLCWFAMPGLLIKCEGANG